MNTPLNNIKTLPSDKKLLRSLLTISKKCKVYKDYILDAAKSTTCVSFSVVLH